MLLSNSGGNLECRLVLRFLDVSARSLSGFCSDLLILGCIWYLL